MAGNGKHAMIGPNDPSQQGQPHILATHLLSVPDNLALALLLAERIRWVHKLASFGLRHLGSSWPQGLPPRYQQVPELLAAIPGRLRAGFLLCPTQLQLCCALHQASTGLTTVAPTVCCEQQ